MTGRRCRIPFSCYTFASRCGLGLVCPERFEMKSIAWTAAACLGVGVVAGACSTAPSAGERATGQAAQPIIGGTADASHPAVVFIGLKETANPNGGGGAACTGTIVKKDVATGDGWVLTAAHCVVGTFQPAIVIQGSRADAPGAIRYSVSSFRAHPNYPGDQDYDLGIVHIRGVSDSTPTMPIAGASDGLVVGQTVTTVGYGTTRDPSMGSDRNTTRNVVDQTIGRLTATQVEYRFDGKGSCHGDSGGPSFVTIGGVETVVGVVSHGLTEKDCLGDGADARVSGGLAFIEEELGRTVAIEDPCRTCQDTAYSGEGECARAVSACRDDADCGALLTCMSDCGASNRACLTVCQTKHAQGIGMYLGAADCGCHSCSKACANDATCRSGPQCGASLEKNECTSCLESACCSELYETSTNNVGYQCLVSTAAKGCDSNASVQKFGACLNAKCSAECANDPVRPATKEDAGPSNENVAEAVADGGDPGTSATEIVTTTGCAVSSAGSSEAPSLLRIGIGLGGVGLLALRRRRSARSRA